jgi:hypothetical protein
MKVLKILNRELGWDNVWILADSWEAAVFSAERESVEEFKILGIMVERQICCGL